MWARLCKVFAPSRNRGLLRSLIAAARRQNEAQLARRID
jgi:hypothetical protein